MIFPYRSVAVHLVKKPNSFYVSNIGLGVDEHVNPDYIAIEGSLKPVDPILFRKIFVG